MFVRTHMIRNKNITVVMRETGTDFSLIAPFLPLLEPWIANSITRSSGFSEVLFMVTLCTKPDVFVTVRISRRKLLIFSKEFFFVSLRFLIVVCSNIPC